MPFLLLCILITLCSCDQQEHWAFDQIRSGEKSHNSTRLFYEAQDPVNGIDLEMIQTEEALKVYLVVHSSPVRRHLDNSKSALVTLCANGNPKQFIGYRFEGGQRILLNSEAIAFLLESLKSGQTIEISLSGYRSAIQGKDFSAHYAQLQKPFHLSDFIQLPF